jgi:capsid assembly protease
MKVTYEHLRGLIFNRPLCIDPDRLAVLVDAVSDRTGVALEQDWIKEANARIDRLSPGAQRAMRGPAKSKQDGARAPYATLNGTAIILVHGTLINRGGWVGAYSGITTTEGIRHQIRSAMADETVQSVIFDFDSPGGQASGSFETASLIRELTATKRTIAVIDDTAASAAYALASACSKILITPSGVAGSIGVVLLHLDHSARLDKAGLAPTLIHAGRKKIDANPYQPLSERVSADLQAEVDAAYAMFVDAVAQGRANLTPAAIRATEAACYVGQAAINAGLADEIGDLESALAELAKPAESAGVSALLSAVPAGSASAAANSVVDPNRIAAFLALPEAVGREDYARIMAGDPQLSIQIAKGALTGMPTKAEREAQARAAAPPPPAPAPPPVKAKTAAQSWDEVVAHINTRMGPGA